MTDFELYRRKRSARAHTVGLFASAIAGLVLLVGILLFGSARQTKTFTDGIGAALVALGAIGILLGYPLVRLNVWISDRYDAREPQALVRIRGWLALYAILLYLMPLSFITSTHALLKRDQNWHDILSWEGAFRIFEFSFIFINELIAPILLIILLHRRSRIFPISAIVYSSLPILLGAIVLTAAFIGLWLLSGEAAIGPLTQELDRPFWINLLISGIIIAYFLRSKRVRRTFDLPGPPSLRDFRR
ncbi:membrane hypothetical protein [Hyphomicrobiales bacterium]|nr:membrane hypothetical protein [Hyphomicrobiales bacterium]